MNKQNKINKFIEDLGNFLENYYSSSFTSISTEQNNDWLILKIYGQHSSTIELSTEGQEVTICFGQSHWHIDNYDEPVNINEIYEATIESVLEILQSKIITYSAWSKDRCLGGCSYIGESLEELVEESQSHFQKADELKVKTWNQELKKIRLINKIRFCERSEPES